jgi:putative acetyltransferase
MKKQKVNVRALRIEDVEALNEMRRMDGCRETITGIISERISQSEEWFRSLSINDHVLVAEYDAKDNKQVVGAVSLQVHANPRHRHSALLGIMVHSHFQGQGIGKKLMEYILDLSDNWLNIVRIELTVETQNERAVKLYQAFRFSIEGTCKYATFSHGKYQDLYIMGRYNFPER